MKKAIFTAFLFVISLGYIFAYDFYAPDTVLQGGVITVLMEPGQNSLGAEIELKQGVDIHSRTKVFRSRVGDIPVEIALLGVPSTLRPGVYSIYALDEDGSEVKKNIIVNTEEFISEDIPLTRSMSSLRQSDDPLKAEQWRNLLVILKTVKTDHVYEQDKLKLPVTDYLRLSSFYGDRRRYLYDDGTSASSIHNGIDYSAEPGTPVYAGGRGLVVFSGERIISGNTVVIEHLPGVYSLYYHLNSLIAGEGDMVAAGEQIGTVGATGLVTGAHLHWEIRVAGVAVSPEPLMSGSIIDKDFILSKMNSQ